MPNHYLLGGMADLQAAKARLPHMVAAARQGREFPLPLRKPAWRRQVDRCVPDRTEFLDFFFSWVGLTHPVRPILARARRPGGGGPRRRRLRRPPGVCHPHARTRQQGPHLPLSEARGLSLVDARAAAVCEHGESVLLDVS